MSLAAVQLILHNYDFSNFSEKIRLILGLKRLSWLSVEIPSHLPKPEYTPLTGGYRRTPALQIGADVFCDTHMIADELERRFPEPSIYGNSARERRHALCDGLAWWAESQLLWPTALHITGINAEAFPISFHHDRAKLHNKPQPSLEQVKRAGENYFAEMCAQLARIESLLDEAHPYLLGREATLADFTVYGAPWLLETVGGRSAEIDKQPKTRDWMARIATIGHGRCEPLSARDALDIARDHEPRAIDKSSTRLPTHIKIGDQVVVSPRDEYTPASGTLQFIDESRIIIAASNERVGLVHVHFPRPGYRVSRPRVETA